MKKLLILLILLSVSLFAFSQNYITECRAYKPKGSQQFGRCIDINVPVYISQGSVRIGNNTYELGSTGGKTVDRFGNVVYLYIAMDSEDRPVDIQINYIKETGRAKFIYLIYSDGEEYCYILQ